MTRISFLITLLLQLLCTLIIVLGQDSPCSEYFTYLIDTSTKERFGQIKIHVPRNASEIRVKVVLSVVAHILQSDYKGALELAHTEADFPWAVRQGKPVWYRVFFPLKEQLPRLTGISVNGQQYCTGSSAKGEVVTSIELEHTVVFAPYVPPVDDDCGNNNNTNTNKNLLIFKGVNISPGEWPWLVAIFVTKPDLKLFQCAGNILTTRHVLTVAHCCKSNNEHINLLPSEMLVSLGRYRLRDWNETGSINREIESYVLHPDYTHQLSGDSDLAILTLKDTVEFSPTIKPICLWTGSSDLEDVINTSGYVVGWGRDEHGNPYVEEPRMARAPVVSLSDCHWSDSRFPAFTSNRTFCAGLRDGSGPCYGDSGSGLMFYNTTTGRYQLRGIVSRSLYNSGEKTCDLSQYLVYVDVTKYEEWIQQQISTG